MLGAEDVLDTDPDEKEASVLAKHEAWLEACHRNTVTKLERIQTAANRFEQLQTSSSPNKAGSAVERLLLERLLLEDERAHLARSRAEERDKLQLAQLRQISALNQRGTQNITQPAQAAFPPGVAQALPQQPVQQTVSWPTPALTTTAPEQAAKPSATPSGFRSFSITGRAKPPS